MAKKVKATAEHNSFSKLSRFEWAVVRLFQNYESAKMEIAKFQAEIANAESGYAVLRELSWAQSAINAAASAKVLEMVIHAIWTAEAKGEPLTHDVLLSTARGEVLRGARSPSRSTSVMSNLAAQAELSAWAEVLESLEAV